MENVFVEIWRGIVLEFSDLPSIESITRLSVRLLLACLLGGLIGYERESSGKSAGIRTHMLVCVGTAFVIAIPQQAEMVLTDLSRIVQGIMAGVGFIGAGTIIKNDQKIEIKGLTTAASIWFTAGIGVAAGFGRESSAALGTFLVLVILGFVPRIDIAKKDEAK